MNAAFVRHFVEMLVAMAVGMMVFGMTGRVTFSLFGAASVLDSGAVWAMVMATYMTVGMSAWMRYRGHSYAPIWEMAGAMYAPFILLLAPLWAGLISERGLNVWGHLLMVLFMLGAMLLRREEYSQHHAHYAAGSAAGHEAAHGTHAQHRS